MLNEDFANLEIVVKSSKFNIDQNICRQNKKQKQKKRCCLFNFAFS